MADLEIVESSRSLTKQGNKLEVVKNPNAPQKPATTTDKALDIVKDNFDDIMKVVGDIVEIKKMKVATAGVLSKMESDRKTLLTEAQVYAQKKAADTSSVVERMKLIRDMMNDFYAQNNGNISGEDFCKVITEIVNQMGKIQDGI